MKITGQIKCSGVQPSSDTHWNKRVRLVFNNKGIERLEINDQRFYLKSNL